MKIIGKPFSASEFPAYLETVKPGWSPTLIVVHHCAAPSLAQRPNGFTSQHMLNLQDFYEDKGWSAGPHLFTDEDQIWTFSPLSARGVHAVSFNRNGIGIEMLGDYDTEDPWTGRGLQVLTTTCRAIKALQKKFGIPDTGIRFHRDDPRTNKTCPGRKIQKQQFLDFLKRTT